MTEAKAGRRTVAIFGGTFDPVHNGHLRMALELQQQLQLDEMRLLPCHRPPHRKQPGCGSDDRAAMVELAVADCAALSVDRRELERDAPSYMVDTLTQLRKELGQETSLILAMGMDSLLGLPGWHRWEQLLELAHLLVVARPGWLLPEAGIVAELVENKQAAPECLRQSSHGALVIQEQSLLPISATAIRQQIAAGQSPQYLIPDSVWRYIEDRRLYRTD